MVQLILGFEHTSISDQLFDRIVDFPVTRDSNRGSKKI